MKRVTLILGILFSFQAFSWNKGHCRAKLRKVPHRVKSFIRGSLNVSKMMLDPKFSLEVLPEMVAHHTGNVFSEVPFYRQKRSGVGRGLWVKGTAVNTLGFRALFSPKLPTKAHNTMKGFCARGDLPLYSPYKRACDRYAVENRQNDNKYRFSGNCAGSTLDMIIQRRSGGKSLSQLRRRYRFGTPLKALSYQQTLEKLHLWGGPEEKLVDELSGGKVKRTGFHTYTFGRGKGDPALNPDSVSCLTRAFMDFQKGESVSVSFGFKENLAGHRVYMERGEDNLLYLHDTNIGLVRIGRDEAEVRKHLSRFFSNYYKEYRRRYPDIERAGRLEVFVDRYRSS